MWRRIIMNTVRMILCGNVEDSRMNPSEKVYPEVTVEKMSSYRQKQ